MENLYDILQVDKNSTDKEIKNAYRKLSKQYHPDMDGGDEEKFKKIAHAYEILSDKDKKAHYDKYGTTENMNNGGFGFGGMDFDLNDIFSNMGNFGGFGDFFGRGNSIRKGQDIRVTINLDIMDIINGVDKKIKYKRKDKCTSCDGKGGKVNKCTSCDGNGRKVHVQGHMRQITICNDCSGTGEKIIENCNDCSGSGVFETTHIAEVKLPAGLANGMNIQIPNSGSFVRGGTYGDLIVNIKEMPHPMWKRDDNNNIVINIEVPIIDMLLGQSIDVNTPYGNKTYNIPKCSKVDLNFVEKNKGIPNLSANGHIYGSGDMIIKLDVKMPNDLSNDDILKLKSLKESFKS